MANDFAYNQIKRYAAVAVPGQAATPSQSVYTAVTYYAGSGGCKAGTFVWPNTAAGMDGEALQAMPSGYTGRPLGLVERVMDVPNYDPRSQGTDVVPENQALTIAVRGDYYVECPKDAVAGDAVYVNTSDGSIYPNSAGWSAAESSGYQETAWRFVQAQPVTSGGIALISNWANQ